MMRLLQFFAPAGAQLLPLVLCALGIWYTFFRSRDLINALRPAETDPEQALRRAERHVGLLAALTAAAPLLGLLGTVTGMMLTFDAVAAPGTGTDTSTRVSVGISQALITTQIGLVVAIPGLFGLARVRRLADHARNRMAGNHPDGGGIA